jgi:uncharacterized protein
MPRRARVRRVARPVRKDRGRRFLVTVVLAAFVLFLSARGISRFATDVLWFESLGYGKVFGTTLFTRIGLGLVFGLVGALAVFANLVAADRFAPRIVSNAPEDLFIVRYRELMARRGTRLRLLAGVVFGFLTGLPMASRWKEWLLFRNAVSFGTKDPQFGKDIGFYVFKLPFESFVVDWLFATVTICLLITAAAHYLNGGIKLQVTGRSVTSHVKTHLSVLLATLAVLKAASYWLARYNLMASKRGVVSGAGYTDVKANLPAIQLLLLISLLAAVLLVVNVRQKGWRLPVIAVGLWLVVALVAGQLYPAIVQRFTVSPNEGGRERLYIDRNIKATRSALGLNGVETIEVNGSAPTGNVSEADLENVTSARLIDPVTSADAFNLQKSQVNNLGGFRFLDGDKQPSGLDVNRYTIDGKVTQVVAAVRELNPNGNQTSWENRHLGYTHGIGYVAADATLVDDRGQPSYLDNRAVIPAQPRAYFAEDTVDYAVVRTSVKEVDGLPPVPYEGNGGVSLSSRFRRLLFALRYGETNLFVSGSITSDSRILYLRDIKQRAETLAPFLSIGGDPYAVVSDGRLVWVLDGFTTTDRYPYAQRVDTRELPTTSGLRGTSFNYVRNSVKVVVDAYTGATSFYAFDPTDPILQAYSAAFPSLLTPAKEMPSAVQATLRYPHDLMQVQSDAYGFYQLTDPGAFYNKNGAWEVSKAPRTAQEDKKQAAPTGTTASTLVGLPAATSTKSIRQAPYFAYLRLPGRETAEFVSLRAYSPFSAEDDKPRLRAFMTASSEMRSYGELRVYRVAGDPPGPSLVDTQSTNAFAKDLTLLDQQGSKVLFSDLQLVPIGDAIGWLRSWFLVSVTNGQNDIPRLDSVTITLGDNTYRGKDRADAIAQAFQSLSGRKPSTAPAAPSVPAGGAESVEALLSEAAKLRDEAQAALKRLSFDEYRAKMEAAYAKLARAAELATGRPVAVTPPVAAPPTTTTSTAPRPSTTASA